VRILHVTPSFYPAWAYGGIPRCAYELARALARTGESVTAWTTDVFDATRRVTERRATVAGIDVRYFPNVSNQLAYRAQLYAPRGLVRAAWREVGDFDVVHVHSHRHLLQAIVGIAARRAGVPYVFTGNGTVPVIERHQPVKRLLDGLGARALLRGAAACIAVSEAERPHYAAEGVLPERISVIPNGLRLEEYATLPARGRFRQVHGIAPETPLVLFVGKVTPRKGVDVLIRAVATLPPAVQLVIAGSFQMPEAPVRQLVQTLGLGERVRFVGLLTGDDKLAAYVDADTVAYPSEHEIFGLVPFEGLLCGTPAVVCDDSGCGEVLRAAGGGLTVPYGDVAALAAALTALLDDAARRAACVASGRRYIAEHLGWDGIGARTRQLYERVVAGARLTVPVGAGATDDRESWARAGGAEDRR